MFKRLKIRAKLMWLTAMMATFILVSILISVLAINKLHKTQSAIVSNQVPGIMALSNIKAAQLNVSVAERGLYIEKMMNLEYRNSQYKAIDIAMKQIQESIKDFESITHTPEVKTAWDDFIVQYRKYLASHKEVIIVSNARDRLIEAGLPDTDKKMTTNLDEILKVAVPSRQLSVDALSKLDEVMTKDLQNIDRETISSAKLAKQIIYAIIICGLLAWALGIIVSHKINVKIQNILRQLVGQAKELVDAALDGDLSVRANVNETNVEFREIIVGFNDVIEELTKPIIFAADYISRISVGDIPPVITEKFNGDFNIIINNLNVLINALNEIIAKAKLVAGGDLMVDLKKRSEKDELMQSLTEMVKSTAGIISEFQAAANNISASSEQMSSTSQEMSQGASEQASSAEEVTSSMEEMAANIHQNTENAQQTEKIALNAADGIAKVAEAAQATLKNIKEIADKVSIIGEIARQTNILALNAAVEAARAGEHGKGFAVVAAEVRKLAERSQLSAVEIDTLTKTSVRVTEDAGKLMAAIVPEINKTAKLVQEITAASIEQNSGAEQVNTAIQQLSQVTQQNAAASEEMATSSEELSSQAQQLMEMISFFKIENDLTGKKLFGFEKSKPVPHINVVSDRKVAPKHYKQAIKTQKGIKINIINDKPDSDYERF
jgi:methyl-accepting chemotaxis protein